MAVNSSRSMNADLHEGLTDGKYRKVRPNTTLGDGRNAEGIAKTIAERSTLHPFYGYGFITSEAPHKAYDSRF